VPLASSRRSARCQGCLLPGSTTMLTAQARFMGFDSYCACKLSQHSAARETRGAALGRGDRSRRLRRVSGARGARPRAAGPDGCSALLTFAVAQPVRACLQADAAVNRAQVVVVDADGSFRVPARPLPGPGAGSGAGADGPRHDRDGQRADGGAAAAAALDLLSGAAAPAAEGAAPGPGAGPAGAGGAAAGPADEGYRDSGAGAGAHGEELAPEPERGPGAGRASALGPGRWACAVAAWRPRRAGPTRVAEVVLRPGPVAEVVWSLAGFPPGARLVACVEPATPALSHRQSHA